MSTNEFLDAFIVGGGPTEECDFCGNTFYSTTALEEEELEQYEEMRRKNPSKFHPEPYDSIEFYVVDGRRYPYGCPCNSLDNYEHFIWEHKEQILRYLNLRSEMEYKEKEMTKRQVEEATKMHETAKKVAMELTRAEYVLGKAKDYIK